MPNQVQDLIQGLTPSGLVQDLNNFGLSTIQQLVNASWTTPVTQTFSTANADHEWYFQEASGNVLDQIASKDLTVAGTVFYSQTAVGVWDGADYFSRDAVEIMQTGQVERVSDQTFMDTDGTTSVGFRLVFRHAGPGVTTRTIAYKKNNATNGYELRTSGSSGNLSFTYNGSLGSTAITLTGNHSDGAWHYVDCVIDATASEVRARSDLSSPAAGDISGDGSASSATDFGFGDWGIGSNTLDNLQITYAAALIGADAENLDSEAFWTMHSDPNAGTAGAIATHNRASLLSGVVANTGTNNDYVCHFSGEPTVPQFPIAELGGNRGLLQYGAITNLIPESEDLGTTWTATNGTLAAAEAEAPDGFRTAGSITATAVNGYASIIWTSVATTHYSLSIWVKTKSGSTNTGRLIFYDETGATEITSIGFTATSEWVRVELDAAAAAGQVSSSLRVEVDTNTEAFYIWGAQAATSPANVPAAPYVRTNGASASSVLTDYRIDNTAVAALDSAAGDLEFTGTRFETSEVGAQLFDLYNGTNNTGRLVILGSAIGQDGPRLLSYNSGGGIEYDVQPNFGTGWDSQRTYRARWTTDGTDLGDVAAGCEVEVIGTATDTQAAANYTPGAVPGEVFLGQHGTNINPWEGIISTFKTWSAARAS